MLREALGQAQGLVNIIKDSMVVASSSEAAASSSASEEAAKAAASPSTSTSSADPETSVDPLAELEEDESSSTTSTTEIPTPSANPWISPYTEDDLKALTDTYESVNTWLEEKLAEQEKLKPYEDPIFAPGELQKKATELNDALMSLLQKKLKQQQPPKPKPKSKTSKTKAAPKPTKKPKAKTAKGEEKLKSVKDEINDKVKSATDKIKTGEKVEFEIKDGKVESKERDEL
jgi:hypoxia up-regulated 1